MFLGLDSIVDNNKVEVVGMEKFEDVCGFLEGDARNCFWYFLELFLGEVENRSLDIEFLAVV